MATVTTAWETVASKHEALITALTPNRLATKRFRLLDPDQDFEEWIQDNAGAALRRFEIRDTSVWETPLVWDVKYKQLEGATTIRIAYPPIYNEFGRSAVRDMQNVINQDIGQIINALEKPSNYVAGQHSAECTASVINLGAILIAEIDCSFIYYQST